MRTIKIIAAAAGLAFAGLSGAADPLSSQPETRAFVQWQFGGQTHGVEALRYGLRVDHDSRYAPAELPSIFELAFGPKGFERAAVNGLPFAYAVRSKQNGQEIEYSVIDLAVLAVGVAAVGFAIAEVADAEDDPDPQPAN